MFLEIIESFPAVFGHCNTVFVLLKKVLQFQSLGQAILDYQNFNIIFHNFSHPQIIQNSLNHQSLTNFGYNFFTHSGQMP